MSKWTRFSAVIAALLVPGPVVAQTIPFHCEWPFAQDVSQINLAHAFGVNNVVRKTVNLYGDTDLMTVIFPDDKGRRLAIRWRDEKNRKGLDRVIIRGTSWSV